MILRLKGAGLWVQLSFNSTGPTSSWGSSRGCYKETGPMEFQLYNRSFVVRSAVVQSCSLSAAVQRRTDALARSLVDNMSTTINGDVAGGGGGRQLMPSVTKKRREQNGQLGSERLPRVSHTQFTSPDIHLSSCRVGWYDTYWIVMARQKANIYALWFYVSCVFSVFHSVLLFSPLGKLADRAIYFACVKFFLFFNDRSENDYLRIYWTDFRNLLTEWERFDRSGPRFPICPGTLPWQPNNVGRSNERGLILPAFFALAVITTNYLQLVDNTTFSSA